ncbi:6-bladed beta-propeller [Butyricimonas paravirosa]|uniref:6-bladed beta-propeller n=1 Tax=Butyricimonas paravirosa TaxID=1472417 RepID=UPI0022E62ED1|nr:6-bladed beta-propeller [Butyricimonas paravirosa]
MNTTCINFDFTQRMKDIHSIDLIKNYKLIPLETRDSVIIGKIDKAILYKDQIYIATFHRDQAVYIFNLQGKFLHKINTIGRGPEEYLQLSDIFIDENNQTLNLLSRIDAKLLTYDINNLNIIKSSPLPKAFYKMISLKDRYLGHSGNYTQDKDEPYNLWDMDLDFRIINKAIVIDPRWESKMANIRPLSTYQDTIFYITPTDFNIYQYDGKKVSISHSVNFGKYQLPSEQISYDEYKKYCLSPYYITAIRIFQETPNYYLYWVVESGQDRLCVYNKKNQESTICELTPYSGKYFISFGDIIDITQKHIITSVEASEMNEYLKGYNEYVNFEKEYPEQIHRMRKELPDIKEDDNPCIVVYSL